MAQCLIIHQGHTCPDALRDAARPHVEDHDVRVGTARLGPEATDPGSATEVSVVVTDDQAVADYWGDRAEVVRPSGLPDWIPRAEALERAGLSSVREVAHAAEEGALEDVKGIGPSTAEKIIDALLDYDAL